MIFFYLVHLKHLFMMEIGLHLRNAMLLNGILYNSEAWHDISEEDMKVIERID